MISILTSFKPFFGDNAVRQNNALRSWRALGHDVEIIAFGETPNIASAIQDFRMLHVPEIASFEGRLPRIDKIFDFAGTSAVFDLQVYVNGDILIFDDFLLALSAIKLEKFVMIGQRLDVEVRELIDFSDHRTAQNARRKLSSTARLHDVGGMDYFAFRRASMPRLPPLYLGAAAWDNAVVYACRKAKVPVIDATLDVQVFHQNHDYPSLADGRRSVYEGPEAHANFAQIPENLYRFYTTDASYWLKGGKLRSSLFSPRHAWRMVWTFPLVREWRGLGRLPFRLVAAVLRRLGVFWMHRSKSNGGSATFGPGA